MAFPDTILVIHSIELQTLASDQNWGNTGFGSFRLVIHKKQKDGDEKEVVIKYPLITVNHDDHPGFYQYEKKITLDKEEDKKKLGMIEGLDKITIQCECAPWPGWQLKVKNANIKVI